MPCLWVLAGTNGAGKSSIAGEMLRRSGGVYFNPDEIALRLREHSDHLSVELANEMAWKEGVRRLDQAIRDRHDYYFETTLGGNTIATRIEQAARLQFEIRVWYAGLATVELHVARVAARVAKGGHDIPEADIRRRYKAGPRNLVRLLPHLTELKLYDNSAPADVGADIPAPAELLHMKERVLVTCLNTQECPEWARPVVAAARELCSS